jgi:hypothetical protein
MREEMRKKSPLSGLDCERLFSHQVLGKYKASYYYDKSIGYIFVDEPYWLEEAYDSAITITDTGILVRNNANANRVSTAILMNSINVKKGVDLGGGYGLFVRGMRDKGFNFFWEDKYAENLMARGFEADEGVHEVAVAFEVLEHLANPLQFLQNAKLKYNFHTCFFTATCFDMNDLPDENWWYWVFETGQHISFFSKKTLEYMASQIDMNLFHFGGEFYAFSSLSLETKPRRIKSWVPKILRSNNKFKKDFDFPKSLTKSDFKFLRKNLQKKNNV